MGRIERIKKVDKKGDIYTGRVRLAWRHDVSSHLRGKERREKMEEIASASGRPWRFIAR